jgi:hypothetical protein
MFDSCWRRFEISVKIGGKGKDCEILFYRRGEEEVE